MTTDVSAPAVVLGVARNYFQHGSLGIVRSLGRLGVTVHGAFSEVDTPATSSRYLAGVHRVEATDSGFVPWMMDIAAEIGMQAVLFPTDDVAAGLVTAHQDILSSSFLIARQDARLVEGLANKKEMAELCVAHDVPTPHLTFPASMDEVEEFAARTDFPVVVKAIDAAVTQRADATSVEIVSTREELTAAFQEMSGESPGNVMLQEYIPGGPEDVWMFNGYFDTSARCLLGYTGRKLRQFPPYTGMTSLGECTDHPEVRGIAIRFLEAVGYTGPVDLGMRYDRRDGTFKMLDINPRMGASFRLFVGRDGSDVARAMYSDLTGQATSESQPVEGRKWFVEHFDLASSISYMRDRRLSPKAWLFSLRGVREGAWFARDDLKPFLMMVREAMAMGLRWIGRRIRRR